MAVGFALHELGDELELAQVAIIRVSSRTGCTLDCFERALHQLGRGDRGGGAVQPEELRALGLQAHRVIRLHDADLADLAVLAAERAVTCDADLRVGRGDLHRPAIDVQQSVAACFRDSPVRHQLEFSGAREARTARRRDGEEPVPSNRHIEGIGGVGQRALLPFAIGRAVLRINDRTSPRGAVVSCCRLSQSVNSTRSDL